MPKVSGAFQHEMNFNAYTRGTPTYLYLPQGGCLLLFVFVVVQVTNDKPVDMLTVHEGLQFKTIFENC